MKWFSLFMSVCSLVLVYLFAHLGEPFPATAWAFSASAWCGSFATRLAFEVVR